MRMPPRPSSAPSASCATCCPRPAPGAPFTRLFAASLASLTVFVGLTGCYRTHERRESADGGADARDDVGQPDASLTAPMTVACGEASRPPSAEGIVLCDVAGSGDHDGDGFPNDVDCNDCVPQINGGAYDIPGNGIDEDCSGSDAAPCRDTGAGFDDGTARSAANALGLCEGGPGGVIGEHDWVRSADWHDTSFAPHVLTEMHRVADGFGRYRPYAGRAFLVLSTGIANDDLSTEDSCVQHAMSSAFPPGFPMTSPACPDVLSGHVVDSVALTLELDVPTNAIGLRFASNFMTREYPDFLCSPFNDVYAVLMTDVDTGELRNIVFDREGNPLTVNNALLRTCVDRGPRRCELGAAPLRGAVDAMCTPGSEGLVGGGTDCVQTTAPVVPGSRITLSFMIWDSGDGLLDSVALVDAFEWVLAPFEQRAR